jgi:ATP/maltotriose-dependent transcriptional regulator MalT
LSAFPEALSHFENALGLWSAASPGSAGPGAGLLLEVAEAARWAGRLERGLELLEQAAVVARTSQTAALVWERIGWFRREAGDGDGALVAYERALEAIGDDRSSAEAAEVLASHAAVLLIAGRYSEARIRGQEAIEASLASGADVARASTLITLGVVEAMTGDPERGLGMLAEGRDIALAAGADEQRWRCVVNTTYVLRNSGRVPEAVDVALEALSTLSPDREYPPGARLVLANATEAMIRLGRWSEAGDLLDAALSRPGQPFEAIPLLIYRAQLDVLRGDLAAARHHLAMATGQSSADLHPNTHAELHQAAAELALAMGDIAAARAASDEALRVLADTEEAEGVIMVLTVALRVEAEAGATPGLTSPARVARMEQLLDTALSEVGSQVVEVEVEEALCHAEISRLRGEDRPDTWEAVAAVAHLQRQPQREAYARVRLAESALRDHDRATALSELRSVRGIASDLGASPLIDAAEGVARRARLKLDEAVPISLLPPRAARLGLTRREVDVLRLLLDGSSNRRIARELAIAEKTASVHVSRILTKLGVSSRGEAAAVAQRLHLLDDESRLDD